jgi:hypothetical protein
MCWNCGKDWRSTSYWNDFVPNRTSPEVLEKDEPYICPINRGGCGAKRVYWIIEEEDDG